MGPMRGDVQSGHMANSCGRAPGRWSYASGEGGTTSATDFPEKRDPQGPLGFPYAFQQGKTLGLKLRNGNFFHGFPSTIELCHGHNEWSSTKQTDEHSLHLHLFPKQSPPGPFCCNASDPFTGVAESSRRQSTWKTRVQS